MTLKWLGMLYSLAPQNLVIYFLMKKRFPPTLLFLCLACLTVSKLLGQQIAEEKIPSPEESRDFKWAIKTNVLGWTTGEIFNLAYERKTSESRGW